jgi:hypothetical protein
VWFEVTSAKIDDVVAGRAIPLEKGATYVFDKGYITGGDPQLSPMRTIDKLGD